jgi:glycosyltransferase involved in cell wall biosynthesis
MKIAILTSGILPVPAVKGGAVENLIDFYLAYNEQHHLHDITIYSVADKWTIGHPALQSTVNHYHYIEVNSIAAKIRKRIFHYLHRQGEYYHYTIEYFLHEAIQHIRHQQYDLILMENRPDYALKLKDSTNAKLVYHLHNEKLSVEVPHYQEIYDAATGIITVSDFIKSRIQTIISNDEKTLTVYNGIDLHRFSRRKSSTINREDIGLLQEDLVMVFSGRINKDKGVAELIDAMLILKDLPQIKLLVIGSTFFGNAANEDDFVLYLKEKAQPIQNRIIFTGFIPYHQMPDYLQLADIAVIPSIWNDPFPTTVLEAQAMGLPIITTRRGGIPEEVTEKNAILLDTDKYFVNNLTAAIKDLYEHPVKREEMAKASIVNSKYYNHLRYAEDFFRALEGI